VLNVDGLLLTAEQNLLQSLADDDLDIDEEYIEVGRFSVAL